MLRNSLFLTTILALCLAVPSAAQQSDSQDKADQSNDNQSSQESDRASDTDQKADGQDANGQQSKEFELAEVSIENGQTIEIPTGASLLELTVAVPDSVRSGQRYRYRARVSNVSESTTLRNVELVQLDGKEIDIESAQIKSQSSKDSMNSSADQNSESEKSSENQQSQESSENSESEKSSENQQSQESSEADAQTTANGQSNSQSQDTAQKNSQSDSQGVKSAWNLDELKPGASRELVVTAVASQTGKIDHCFSVEYQEVLCTQVEVVKPTVSIAKAGPDQVSVCEVFEYRYELENTGTGVAKDFVVRDKLAEGLKTKSGQDEIEFRVPLLEANETKAYVAEVHAMEPGEYASRATVEQKAGRTRESKNVSTEVIAPELNLEIEGPRVVKAGEGGRFDVTVTNTSDVVARGVTLTVDPSENAEITDAGDGDARDGGDSYRYRLGDLEPGDSQSASISADASQKGDLSFSAVAKSICEADRDKAQEKQRVVAEAESNMESRVLKITSLALSVVDTDDVIPTGESITYRIRVRNQGSFADEDVKVDLNLPSGLSFDKADGPTEGETNGRRVSLGTVDKIDPGETLEWHVTATAEAAGEKIVEGTLDSKGLSNTVEAEEVSTFYDDSRQKAEGETSDSAKSGSRSE